MAISLRADAPRDGAKVIGKAVRDLGLFSSDDPLAGGAALDLSKPIPIYRLKLDDLREYGVASLDKAEMVGWRYLLETEGGGEVSYVDLHERNNDTRFSSIARNPNAAALLEAAGLAERAAKPLEGDCELRAIEVPAAKVAALWIVHATASFVPYIDGAAGAPIRGKQLSPQDFFAELNKRLPEADERAPGRDLMSR
jgi:hypothetical protein